jgi:hypothetical protein
LPHITMLERYLITANLGQAYAAIAEVLANTDASALSYHVPGITYSEHWGLPGQAAAVLGVHPNQQVLNLQAALLVAVTPFIGSGGTDAAFVTDPGQQISATTKGLGRDLPTEPDRSELRSPPHRRTRHRRRPQSHAGRAVRRIRRATRRLGRLPAREQRNRPHPAQSLGTGHLNPTRVRSSAPAFVTRSR